MTRHAETLTFRQMRFGDYTGMAYAQGESDFDLFDSPPPLEDKAKLAAWLDNAPFLVSEYHLGDVDAKRKNTTVTFGVPRTNEKLCHALELILQKSKEYVMAHASEIWPNKGWTGDPDKVRAKLDGEDDDPLFRPGINPKHDKIYVDMTAKLFSHAQDRDGVAFTKIFTPDDVTDEGDLVRGEDGGVKMTALPPAYLARGSRGVCSITFDGIERVNTTGQARLKLRLREILAIDPKLNAQIQRAVNGGGGSKRARGFYEGHVVVDAPPPKRFTAM